MKRIGIVKSDTLVSLVNWIGVPSTIAYVACMIFAPWVIGRFNWGYVQNVWDRWQTLNVGVLAFISSVIAFNISKYNENKLRERRFVAARAFLPHALSDLTSYCKSSSALLSEAWEHLDDPMAGRAVPLARAAPDLPGDYKEIFSRCIAEADSDVGDHLAKILVSLQIHHSRLRELASSFSEDGRTLIVRGNVMSYLYSVGELQALINRVFNFARGFEDFNGSPLSWDEFRTAYSNLDVNLDEVDDLGGFTQRAIARRRAD